MKIIFTADVPRTGKRFEIKDISDGFARNFLFPKGLAVPATSESIKKYQAMAQKMRDQDLLKDKLLDEMIEKLDGSEILMTAPANEKGNLYKGIGKDEIIARITEEKRAALSPERIELGAPLKEVGSHPIELLGKDKRATITVRIEPLP